MILTKQQQKELETVARPLIEWLNKNCHPHVTAIVNPARVELLEGVCSIPVEDYISD
ncbi:MAG: hypothetical protein Q8K02_00595 [Flavobacterium sp.]|nr:hypothetical protein [Flavobacterium sp.]